MRERVRAVGSFLVGTGRGQPVGGAPLDFEWKLCSNEELGIRNEGGGFAANIYGGDARKWWGAAIRGKRISNIRGSQPRLATLDSPFQRKGRECGAFRVYQSLLPLEGGARRAEVRGAERSEKGASQAGDLRKHPSAADAVPLPRWGRLRRSDASRRFFIKSDARK